MPRPTFLIRPTLSCRRSTTDSCCVNDATEQPDTSEPDADDTMGLLQRRTICPSTTSWRRPSRSTIATSAPSSVRLFRIVRTKWRRLRLATSRPTKSFLRASIRPTPSLNTSNGYKPITGSIFDLLDASHVTWFNYFADLPTSLIFRGNHCRLCGACPPVFSSSDQVVNPTARISWPGRGGRHSARGVVRRSLRFARPDANPNGTDL